MYYYTDQVLDWFKDFLTGETQLGLKHISWGEPGDIIPEYPAVLLANAPKDRTIGNLHQFDVEFNIDLYVLHANLEVGHEQRTREDIQLCNQITDMLDQRFQLPTEDEPDGNIIAGWITSERPGVISRRGTPVVATRLSWFGRSKQPFMIAT